MKNTTRRIKPSIPFLKTASCLALIITGFNAGAAENYRLRQAPAGAFGGEIAAPADNPGLFGTAILSYADIYRVADASGNAIKLPAIASRQLNPALPYKMSFSQGTINFDQRQSQLNLLGDYLTEDTYADGRIAFAANLPLIKISRSFSAVKVAAGASLYVPTGAYDKTRGPNPGFGNFYTFRPGRMQASTCSTATTSVPAMRWWQGRCNCAS